MVGLLSPPFSKGGKYSALGCVQLDFRQQRNSVDLKAYLEERRGLVNRALTAYLPQVRGPAFRLNQAMHYSLFVGGKRLRPILCLAAAEAVGGDSGEALPVACALEMIHTYSL